MIPLCVPNISGNEGRYLAECVSSTFVSTIGPFVSRFETMVAEAAGTQGAVATSAGTTALHAALIAVGVQRDDLVICPALTFIASANAISHTGATPWLFDVDPASWTLDPALLSRELAEETQRHDGQIFHAKTGRRVSAIVPVFTLGIPADMDPILATAREYGLKVVVDGAAALGALYKGRKSGALGADLTMYSFNGNKTTTAGGGGAVAGDSDAVLAHFRHLTTTGRVGTDYDHDVVAFNYRMTNLQAAVGCAQMERLDEFVAAKRRIAARYEEGFRGLNGIGPFPDPEYATSPAWFSGFAFQGEDGGEKSRALRAYLREKSIDARPFWKPMHDQKPYASAPRTKMPVTDTLWRGVVTLPCSTHLTRAEQDKVIETVLEWFESSAL
ncbi:Predicted pyridoxal phosphate-dependent enzyme [Pseudorhizobium banfieldiae]|uniref:Predicted pyridoxal phosphate-dependent enzyme n=1 Tax=Pseudorhizobium banfieldiae TaxID=1125847 RepID=L0NKN0_9HYPH|nr:DegT/DnrJ/EryC1/StrS family aminotransferase [Pseudorhizobium banfieldiae]CAD6617772.1 pyridoxal-5'-phosphate-dependent protein [arsenite-oxidising bacterium NT-25]CCF20862.1 Predicted pyridoxal phosphate-dependent enzyme [Pseudorhizobium banfieldiae]